MQALLRFVVAAAVSVAVVLSWGSPASAHGGSGTSSTNYRVHLFGFNPPVEGFSVKLIEAGDRVEVRVTGDKELTVLGYANEPYLRVGPDGAFENTVSPSKTLNRGVYSSAARPDAPMAAPSWKKLSSEPMLRWHDLRANYGEKNKPEAVSAHAGASRIALPRWEIPVESGGQRAAINGSVDWVPGPSSTPKVAVAAVIAIALAALAFTRRWRTCLAIALTALVLLDIEHALLVALVKTDVSAVLSQLFGGVYAIAGWLMAAGAVRLLHHSKNPAAEDALFFAVLAAIILGVIGGLTDVSDLYKSQVAAVGPAELTRWSVAITLGLGFGVIAGAVGRLARARVIGRQADNSNPMPPNV